MAEARSTERRKLDVEVAVLQTEVKHLKASIEDLNKNVDTLNTILNQTKGGWFVITIVAAAACSIGAILSNIFFK